ncbi:protein-methionine-sulfoxide reductase catalytic subunit MsrP [Rhodovarius crocodyli]|uniref:Protein-methionine-sulfoxide reductase catalytic subunit MsrP n=1 Tax=Rhodovarius crocodyli TaxID=1979269 RepID=A0A437LXJ1_9PROT|nr:protein-methionine-sulfoxide reductase catalytic subunit MsrP [Rhodovarius crocodyli]RVT90072.1 protein-methionine-sulfoxide reductase catalytic subunit MsrP [Rhodovarius crocodyli]
MNIIRRKGWALPESAVTPREFVLNRRALMGAPALLAAGPALAQTGAIPPLPEHTRNAAFDGGRAITAEREATNYNNFYEFGTYKGIARDAQRMPRRPWRLKVEGLVENPREFEIDDLIRMMPIEERVLRLRCVEAWAMTVPWSGFALKALLDVVKPMASAKYLAFQTASIPSVMPGLRQSWYPWPHTEACTIQEAGNELSFMAVGMYGNPLPAQNGAPIRVLFPWKYGFKSGKSIVRINFQEQRPDTFWGTIQPQEYGFWANVNPEVPHPRWSQASERLIGSGERVPTRIWNGYGEQVASMYEGMRGERLFL